MTILFLFFDVWTHSVVIYTREFPKGCSHHKTDLILVVQASQVVALRGG